MLTARPKRTLLFVVLFVIVAGVVGGPVAGSLQTDGGFAATSSGSARAEAKIEQATGTAATPGVVALMDTPQRAAAVREQLAAQPGIAAVAKEPTLSRDGRSAYLLATLTADADDDTVVNGLQERFPENGDVLLGGSLFAQHQIGESVSADLGRAEMLAFPILLLLSLLFFRGRATVLPLVVGITTVLGTFLVLTAVNQAYHLSIFALNLVIGLGLGLAIDYSLFLVTRFREELAKDNPDAVRTTMRTAGRTVAFSAVTVALAMITLTVFPLGFLKSMGVAGAAVSIVAGAAALVITPATFAIWGTKLSVKPRGRQGGWYRLAHGVMRRPLPIALATGALMVVIALPSLRAVWTPVDSTVIPKGQSARTVADTVDRDFPGGQGSSPLAVVLTAPQSERAGVERYAATLETRPGVRAVSEPRALNATTWQIDVLAEGEPVGPAARDLVGDLRDVRAPYPTLIGGAAADFVDQQAAIGSNLPLAIGLLVGLTMLVLWLMTGSIVLPIKAIIMNALTVGASLGILTLVFQDGRFEGLLGYTGNGGVEPTDFLVAAALVFALSTDYGVFLLGRIKEAREGGLTDREAVAVGVERTGAVVTAAAILLAVAIGAFITSSISFIQQIGVATAAGVLIDAFIVRALLVPSLMGLLGRWNWWSPRPLTRLHTRVRLREATT
ncbi:MMPL family transporter [Solirubrobacter ginsenosidimutans]|uniref:MMPL family transporter n=1 Tax=Solirubrobacter ginsenosidimutans TaxID=490573 RepID=A0A9X3MRQ1_9ACTN|nr:MMPL family transporter [Solirubrobacter ginsenosidimutans]MDA0160706.1 MMPL family transporter [Solirubrobacter ginsenosidimutans]